MLVLVLHCLVHAANRGRSVHYVDFNKRLDGMYNRSITGPELKGRMLT